MYRALYFACKLHDPFSESQTPRYMKDSTYDKVCASYVKQFKRCSACVAADRPSLGWKIVTVDTRSKVALQTVFRAFNAGYFDRIIAYMQYWPICQLSMIRTHACIKNDHTFLLICQCFNHSTTCLMLHSKPWAVWFRQAMPCFCFKN